MKRLLSIIMLSISILITGCFPIYRDIIEVDDSLTGLVKYITENTQYKIEISAHDGRSEERNDIRIGVVLNSSDVAEQYSIINSVIELIDEYLNNHNDIDGSSQEIYVCFVLPVDRYSGVPGEGLCDITNQSVDGSYENALVRIRPLSYGYHYDNENNLGGYEIPDYDFYGIHIMSLEYTSSEEIEEYISSWDSIDTVYVSTTEQATELQSRYPYISFIGYDR